MFTGRPRERSKWKMPDAAERLRIKKEAAYWQDKKDKMRRRMDWPLDKVMSSGRRSYKQIVLDGVSMTVHAAAKKVGRSDGRVRHHLSSGKSLSEALGVDESRIG